MKFLKLILTSWLFPLSTRTPIIALGILASSVANAAPPIPQLNITRNNGSSIRLIDTPSILRSRGLTVSPCACLTEVNRLIIKRNGRSNTTILIYVSPYLYISPSAPSHFTSPGDTSQHINAHTTENPSDVIHI